VIDGATNSVITTIGVGDYPIAFAWNPFQNRTYVANYLGSSISVIRDVVGIEEAARGKKLEARYELQLYPSPFSKQIQISFGVGQSAKDGELKIYNATGKLVKSFNLVLGIEHQVSSVQWSGDDDSGHKLPAGVYFCRLETDEFTAIKKIVKLHCIR